MDRWMDELGWFGSWEVVGLLIGGLVLDSIERRRIG